MQTKPKPSSFDALVGVNLRGIRKLRAVSQGDLAEAMGVIFQQIQKYEKGENRVSATRLYKAAKFLDVDLMRFFDGYEDSSRAVPNENPDIFGMDMQTYRVLKLFERIEDKALRRAVLKMLENIST